MSRKSIHFAVVSSLAVLGGMAAAGPAAAVEAMVDAVTVTATRTEKPADEVPASVSVITSREIEDRLVRDIKDLVEFEPGVSVRTTPPRFTAAGSGAGRDGNSGFNIRGLEGNRVLLLVDGVRAPDAYSFGAQNMGRGDYVDLDVLKSVEIVRGPASAIYGSDGLAGSVSYITRDPSDMLGAGQAFGGRARVGYASADDSWSESLVLAGQGEHWEAMVAYTRRDGHETETQGSNDARNTDRTSANPEDDVSNAVLAKLVFKPADGHRLRLTYDHLDHDIDWTVYSAIAKPPLISTSAIGLVARDEVQRDRVSLDHSYVGGEGWLSAAHATLYYQDSTTRQFSAEDRFTAPDRTRDATFDNRVWGGVIELQSETQTGPFQHRIVYGADYSKTRQEGIRDGTVPPAGETFPTRAFPTTDYTLAGAFIEDEIVSGPVSIFPALRFDHYELEPQRDALYTANVPAGQSDSHVSPKLGLVVRASDRVQVFANVAMGFKAPAPSQVNNGFTNPVSNYRSVPNPALKPETSQTFEVGVRVKDAGWSVDATAFTGTYDDFIDQVQVSGNFTPANPAVYQYVNLGKVEMSGAELKVQAALGAGFTAMGAASYAHGSSNMAGVKTPLATIEPVKLVAGLGWADAGKRFGGQLTAVRSEGKEADRAGITCTGGCYLPSDFTILNLTAYWNVTDQATVRAGFFNLTDETYYWWGDVRGVSATSPVIEAYSQPGRNFSASLAYRF